MSDRRSAPAILVVAGESSGDMHAALLIAEIRRRRGDVDIVGIGGERMREQGARLLYHASEMNVVGFIEVLRRYRFLKSAFRATLREAGSLVPSLAILVDYPGFNLRLARELKGLGIPVVYYIAPQVWAWKEGRVEALRRYVDDLIVAFPFEVEYFKRHGIEARFFGHPLVDHLAERAALEVSSPAEKDVRSTIAYLPGSRPEEIRRHMPLIAEVMRMLGDRYRHVVPLASTVKREELEAFQGEARFEILDSAHAALRDADAALVKSGTSTVEATMHGVPFAVFYRTSWPTFWIARLAIRVPFIAMTNILAGRRIVREFVQREMTPEALAAELRALVDDSAYRAQVIADLDTVRRELGSRGAASRAAEFIVEKYL